ncbi:hypothetical protein HOLleu_29632 [Holothuria leucospilota]|uniref:Uncharacterized protein n=1 Tax=Holothuria leucospilota TaxID=206669 RepID=A0A9Q1H1W1_HOLLE|nr:hypothetical protein HOLleu_29632 [Holothuria leucospilota]
MTATRLFKHGEKLMTVPGEIHRRMKQDFARRPSSFAGKVKIWHRFRSRYKYSLGIVFALHTFKIPFVIITSCYYGVTLTLCCT